MLKKWPKYSFINKEKKLVGFHLDLLEIINKNLNTNIKLKIYNNWEEAYDNSLRKTNESIFGLSWSLKREKIFSYSPSYYFSQHNLLIKKDNFIIKSIKDIKNKTYVSLKNSISNQLIEDKHLNTKIIYVKTLEEVLQSINQGKADASFLTNVDKSLINKYNLKIVDQVYSKYGNLSIGTSKNNKTLTNIYAKAINSINKEQLDTLNKKWFKKKEKSSIFTKNELMYIKKSPKIITGIDNWGNVLYVNNNKILGMVGDILKKIEDISGLEFIPDEDSWPNLINKIKNKKIDFIPTIFHTKEREKFGHFSQSYFKAKEYIFVNQNNYDIHSVEDLNYKKVAIIKEYKSIDLLKKHLKNINIIETNNLEESILMLINNEVDAIFETQIAIKEKINELLISNLKNYFSKKDRSRRRPFFIKKR